MAFADLFSQENVGNLMADPRMQLGLALMAKGRPGSSSQTLGQAGLGASQLIQQQQHAQQLQAYRQAQMQQMQQAQQLQMQSAQAKQDQLQRQQAALQDPAVLDQLGPMGRAMANAGLDIGDILRAQGIDNLQQHRQATLAQQQSQFDTRQANVNHGGGQLGGPRMRAMPTLIPEHLPDGMIQDHKLNPQTGEFEPFGAPYSKYAPGRAKANKAVDAMADEIAPAPDQGLNQLPGQGSLGSYAPQSSGPVGVMPMSAAGSLSAAKTAQAPATPKTKADYDALPAGARYVDPASGKVAVKRG